MKVYKYALSVIIPTFNRSLLLSYTLESLIAQQLGKEFFEVIISDDGSNDDSRAVADRYTNLLNLKYVFQEDLGNRACLARNNGITAAEGRICVLIDSGVILHSNCLIEHLNFYADNNNLKSAIGYVYGFNHSAAYELELKNLIDIKHIDRSIENLHNTGRFADIRNQQYLKYKDSIEDLPAPWFYFWTCHVSSLRDELMKVNLFDSNYDGIWGFEDLDLGFRLASDQRKIYLLKSAKAIHYPHGGDKQQLRLEAYENLKYFHKKYNTTVSKIFFDGYLKGIGKMRDLNQDIIDQLY